MVRDPQWYFLSIFGEPGKKGKWGWRFEGHHLSMNFTLHDGVLVSATPMIFGANPAEVKTGKQKGLKPLPETEVPFRDLLALLDQEQKKTGISRRPCLRSKKTNRGRASGPRLVWRRRR